MFKRFIKYHISISKNAWRNTVKYFELTMPSLIKTCLLWAASILITVQMYSQQIDSLSDTAIVGIASALLTFAVLFFWNLLLSPCQLDAKKNNRIEILEHTLNKQQQYKDIYEALSIQYQKGQQIRRGDFGPCTIIQIEAWLDETSTVMTQKKCFLSEIREFKNPYGVREDDPLQKVHTHLGYLDSYIKRYMDRSEVQDVEG